MIKKLTLALLCVFGMNNAIAQDQTAPADTTKVWKTKGNASVLFNQSTFDNWLAGGENNISGTIGVNYDFNYKKTIGVGITSHSILRNCKTRTSSFAKKRMTV